ncbi:MAG: SulP family inorganic anion transporter [Acidobacteria bacterium]|nr:SulP family inorganic anion transporter [Acidobacteriota bacterium]
MHNVPERLPTSGAWIKDLSSSLVVFLVALPLCMGIALASGVPPARGLMTGIIGGIIVGLLSGSPLQVSGPAAGLAVIVFQLVREHGIAALGPVLIVAGAIQLVAGLLKTGRWFRAISPEVIHGMLAGIGVLIVIQQFHVLLDRTPKSSGPANIMAMGEAVFSGFFPLNGSREEYAALIGILTIAVMLLWEKFRPAKLRLIPGALLGIVAATALAQALHLGVNRVKVAELSSMISLPTLAPVHEWGWGPMLLSAAALAFIASAETLLSAAAVEQMQDKVRTNYDKELAAQGVGNMLCGIVGALPMTGVIVRSSANVQAGAETRRSTILHGTWLLLFVLLLPFVLRMIPTASLAAVLVITGIRLVKPADVRHLRKFGWAPVLIYLASLITIVTTNLLTGVLVGIGLSLFKLLWKLTHLETKVEQIGEGQALVRLSGVGTFIGIPKVARTLDSVPHGCCVHIDASGLRYIDHACIDVIDNWARRRRDQGHLVHLEIDTLLRRYKTPISQPVV